MSLDEISAEQRLQILNTAQAVQSLTEQPGWAHFECAVQALIEQHTPNISGLKNADHSLQIASQSVFVAGLRSAMNIPKQQKQLVKELLQLEEDLKKPPEAFRID